MAIGWMYREDYARAGIRLTSTLSDTRYAARSTVLQALFYATLMVAVSLWPFALGTAGYAYAAAAIVLRDVDALSQRLPARDLLRASVIYLPLLLAVMMLDARGRLLF
jgi:protoheme IX farnesyltransferase